MMWEDELVERLMSPATVPEGSSDGDEQHRSSVQHARRPAPSKKTSAKKSAPKKSPAKKRPAKKSTGQASQTGSRPRAHAPRAEARPAARPVRWLRRRPASCSS